MGSAVSQSHKEESDSSRQNTLPTGSVPTRLEAHASGLAGPRARVKRRSQSRWQADGGSAARTPRARSGLRGSAVSFHTPAPQTRAPESGDGRPPPRPTPTQAQSAGPTAASALLFRKGTEVSRHDTRSPNVSARHTTRLSERPLEPAGEGQRGRRRPADPGGAGSLGPAGGFSAPRRERLPLGQKLPAPCPWPHPCPRPRPSEERSRALDIRLCQRKKERIVDLPFPELLSVLFQNDITESNHEIYMGGVGGRGRGRQLAPDSVTRGEACGFQLSVFSPPRELRANTGDVSST